MADVAVAVDGDAGDVEDGADDAEAHQEAADLALEVAGDPAVVEDGREHQGVGVDGHQQVGQRQAHHKGVSWKHRYRERDRELVRGLGRIKQRKLNRSELNTTELNVIEHNRTHENRLE